MSALDSARDQSQHIRQLDREFILHPWSIQSKRDALVVTEAKGCYFWGPDGKRYLDFHSQFVNVNIGHDHPHVKRAIQEQLDRLTYIAPTFANDKRAELAQLVAEVTPGDLKKTFFTTGGGESNENAVKIARAVTGRLKIIARYRSYHGATYGAISLTGDPRRPPAEPGIPGVVHCFQPYRYRCLFCRKEASCNMACFEHLQETVEQEGPETIAAIVVEPVTGMGGILVPPPDYLSAVRRLCDQYGILLIADEVMSGWGRTGAWFACDHWNLQPDILTTAKGITSSYIPLGAVVVSQRVAQFFEDRMLWAGLTHSGHPLACAAGVATIQVYREEKLVENSQRLGTLLVNRLKQMEVGHRCVGDARSIGLFACLELVKDKGTRAPIVPYLGGDERLMGRLRQHCLEQGLYVSTRWNLVYIAPPLCITEEELEEGLAVIDKGLELVDQGV